MKFAWDTRKNELVKQQKGRVGFEVIEFAISTGGLLDQRANIRYPNQFVLVVLVGKYVHVVPYEVRGDVYWLITEFPSRRETKRYMGAK